jgi:hypothetical protein
VTYSRDDLHANNEMIAALFVDAVETLGLDLDTELARIAAGSPSAFDRFMAMTEVVLIAQGRRMDAITPDGGAAS